MRILIVSLFLVLTSCGTSKINKVQSDKSDTFSDETFMRYGHSRLSNTNVKNDLQGALRNCYKGNFSKGLGKLKSKLNKNKNNHKYWLYLGNCYELYGNIQKSNFYYEFALGGSNSIKAAVLNNRSLIAMKGLNYNEANELLTKAIKLAPQVKVPRYNLAQLYIKFNHTQKARTLLAPYIVSSSDTDLIFSMMAIELIENNLEESKKWNNKFNEKDLKREDISLYRALLFFELKDYKSAKMALGMQRPTIIKEIQRATRELNSKIDVELKRIQERDSKDAKGTKGVNRVAVKTRESNRLQLIGHNQNFVLTKKKLLIGSNEKCDIIINDKKISSYHAILILNSDGGAKIIDLDSNNGTLINNERIENGIIYPGDNIQFADQIFNVDEIIEDIQRNETIIDDEDKDVHTIQEQEMKIPTPVLPPVPGLVIIDGEYCDIKFDEEDYSPVTDLDHLESIDKEEYVDTIEQKKFIPIARKNENQAVQVTILSMGTILSVDYYPMKDSVIRVSSDQRKKNTIVLNSFDSKDNTPFINIKNGSVEVLPMKDHQCKSLTTENIIEQSHTLSNSEVISYNYKTVQVLVKVTDAPPSLRKTPFFGRDRDFKKQTAKVFSTVMSLMLLLLFVDLPQPEEEKKIAVIYRPAVKAKQKNNTKTSENPSKVEVDTGVKKEQQDNKKPKMAKKNPNPSKMKKSAPSKTKAPAKKKMAAKSKPTKAKRKLKSYSFKMNKSMASYFGNSGAKSAKSVTKNSASSALAATTSKSASANSLKASSNSSVTGLGKDFKGSFDSSSGSKGLASKSGIDTTYTDQKAVVLGSMDPELLRKILREYLPQFKHCYQEELEYTNEHAKGVMDLLFRINKYGKANRISIKTKGSKFSKKGTNCMSGVLKLIQFPKPKGGGVVDVKQPLNFLSQKSKI
jgi:Tfp pilus assembly protein PilF